MALTDEGGTGMVMPVSPMYGGGYGQNSGWGFGGDGWWIILLFILLGNGWNNGGYGGFGGGSGSVYPWMLANNTDGLVTAGFANANTTSLLGDIQNQLTTGFANAEIGACNRTMAEMNQRFADTTALTGQLNSLAMGLQNCCCENRAAVADLKYTVATEACADRAAVNDALRDVLTANTAATQRILDQMCQDKIDAKNEKIADLERQLTMANLAASQTAQTSRILADNAAQTVALEQYLNPTPIPAYMVQNPNCCNYNYGCGCGCGGTGSF